MGNEDIIYDYWWAGMERSYHVNVKQIALEAGSTRRLYEMEREELAGLDGVSGTYADDIVERRSGWDLEGEYEKFLMTGIRMIPWYSDEYPRRLKEVAGHPFAIFCLGRLPDDDKLSVAVIGARDCSQYGRMTAERFGADLAGYGVQIVSGMAYGIDGLSQKAAMEAGGLSFAVLGCGVNTCYPASNRGLDRKSVV